MRLGKSTVHQTATKKQQPTLPPELLDLVPSQMSTRTFD